MANFKYHRQYIRLKGFDYTQIGSYFITICTFDHIHLFGQIQDGVMNLNQNGQIAQQCWDEIPNHFPHTKLGGFVVMPNHIHGVIHIVDDTLVQKYGNAIFWNESFVMKMN